MIMSLILRIATLLAAWLYLYGYDGQDGLAGYGAYLAALAFLAVTASLAADLQEQARPQTGTPEQPANKASDSPDGPRQDSDAATPQSCTGRRLTPRATRPRHP